jgi:sRNA-binding regulator protein Hfq
VVKSAWFGREINVLLSNGKTLSGELVETSEQFIVLNTAKGAEVQIMSHAIMVIRPAEDTPEPPA